MNLGISGEFHVDPSALIRVLLSLGITTFSVAGAGQDIAATILADPLAPGNKIWNLQPVENPHGYRVIVFWARLSITSMHKY